MKQNIGLNAKIDNNVQLFYPSVNEIIRKYPTRIGNNCIIRSGTVIYCDVTIGNDFQTGHNVLVRESTYIGDNVKLGTGTIIENKCIMGNDINIQSGVYIPTYTYMCSEIFIGPNVTFTNDMYPPLKSGKLDGIYVGEGVVIGANATILPGVDIGDGAFIAAGAVVTKEVPTYMMAIGSPARFKELPEMMRG